MRVVIFLFGILTSLSATGFDQMPEFKTVWNDHETSRYLNWVDSEYRSDFLWFQLPVAYDRQWITEDKVYQVSVGSMSSKEFLIEQRLKFAVPLAGPMDFRFHWYEERDWEEDSRSFIWDFGFHNGSWRYSVFGQAHLYKEENDAGLAAEFRPTPGAVDRLGIMAVDFDRNERAQGEKRWKRQPFAVSVTGHRVASVPDRSYFVYYLRWESSAIALDRDEGFEWERDKTTFGMRGEIARWEDRAYEYRLHLDEKSERHEALDGSGHNSSEYEVRRLMATFAHRKNYGANDLVLGIAGFHVEVGAERKTSELSDVLPFVWYKWPRKNRENWSSRWAVGADVAFFNIYDKENIISANLSDEIESRLNVKYEMLFADRGGLDLLFTFDVDRFGTSETWEGGAAQMNLQF